MFATPTPLPGLGTKCKEFWRYEIRVPEARNAFIDHLAANANPPQYGPYDRLVEPLQQHL